MKTVVIIIIIIVFGVLAWMLFFNKPETEQNPEEAVEGATLTNNTVVLETDFGPVKIALNRESAPKTSENFAKLVSEGFYNSLTFHRVIPGFVVQGGDPAGDGTGGPGYTIPAEIGLLHKTGSVAMARLPDQVNPLRTSSGSQFYIALQDLPDLDGAYTVFGKIIEGMEVVGLIEQVETDQNDKPAAPVTINKAYIEQ
jgi:peptidyl-prolyl cis-trans isomerase B (cyclophilin B)